MKNKVVRILLLTVLALLMVSAAMADGIIDRCFYAYMDSVTECRLAGNSDGVCDFWGCMNMAACVGNSPESCGARQF